MEWKNVKTELPKNNTKVLCSDGRRITMCTYMENDLWHIEKNASYGDRSLSTYMMDVTYWMLLPELPK